MRKLTNSLICITLLSAIVLAGASLAISDELPATIQHRDMMPSMRVSTNAWLSVSNNTDSLIRDIGGNVKSVNGKTGHVNLDAYDVCAVAATNGFMTGNYVVSSNFAFKSQHSGMFFSIDHDPWSDREIIHFGSASNNDVIDVRGSFITVARCLDISNTPNGNYVSLLAPVYAYGGYPDAITIQGTPVPHVGIVSNIVTEKFSEITPYSIGAMPANDYFYITNIRGSAYMELKSTGIFATNATLQVSGRAHGGLVVIGGHKYSNPLQGVLHVQSGATNAAGRITVDGGGQGSDLKTVEIHGDVKIGEMSVYDSIRRLQATADAIATNTSAQLAVVDGEPTTIEHGKFYSFKPTSTETAHVTLTTGFDDGMEDEARLFFDCGTAAPDVTIAGGVKVVYKDGSPRLADMKISGTSVPNRYLVNLKWFKTSASGTEEKFVFVEVVKVSE